jgi:hypothetical protein
MNNIIRDLQHNFFTEAVVEVLLVVVFILAVKKRKSKHHMKYLILYLLFYFALVIYTYIFRIIEISLPFEIRLYIDKTMNYLVTVVEFIAFSEYLYNSIGTKKTKKIVSLTIWITTGILLLLGMRALINPNQQEDPVGLVYLVQCLSFTLICSIYFIDLFRLPPKNALLQTPSFWIASGLLVYSLGTFPVTILTYYTYVTDYLFYKHLYAIIYIFYSLLFITIIRAYMCIPGSSNMISGHTQSNIAQSRD